jgi:hypothetical protein
MIILLTVIAIVITGVPLAAVALVTVASRREETARSIAGRAPGPLERAARGLLAFHTAGIGHPSGPGRLRLQDRDPRQPARDDRFAGDPAPADSPIPAGDPAPDDRLALAT